MEKIVDVKRNLKSNKILEILSECVYMPSEEKLNRLAEEYINSCNTVAYGYSLNNEIYGVVVLDISKNNEITIVAIAVKNSMQNIRIGSKMIKFIIEKFNPEVLIAETDDDSVEFYRKCGFKIKNLGNKYKNTTRYECKYL